eukprot:m.227512 g.227512  ORF g.227512 m.227512 type:complete len:111 (+) comp11598_c0_seq1:29-361(+)
MDFIAKKVFDSKVDGFKKDMGFGDDEEDKQDPKSKDDKKKSKAQAEAEAKAAEEKLRARQAQRREERESNRDQLRAKYNLAGGRKPSESDQAKGGAPAQGQGEKQDCRVM